MDFADIKVILCDIDDTITTFNGDYNANDYVGAIFTVFASFFAEKTNITLPEAQQKIREYADDVIWWDYPDFITDFGLPSIPVWTEIRKIHQEHLSVFDDAVEMIKSLHKSGKIICIISNNPITGCLLKLERAGLADLTGSQYITRIFGTNLIKGMKSQPIAWNRAIASLGVTPSEILTIGDSVKEDLGVPRDIGVKNTVIIDRSADIPLQQQDNYLQVNNLTNILMDW